MGLGPAKLSSRDAVGSKDSRERQGMISYRLDTEGIPCSTSSSDPQLTLEA